MPTTVISTAITVPASAGSTINSHFIVTGTGSISVGSAVALGSNAASGFAATIYGTVESYWSATSFVAAIYASTPASRITVGSTGRVYGEREAVSTGSGVVWTAGAGSVVTNHGTVISGTIEAVRLAHSGGNLTNTGLISGFSSALIATGTGTRVDNSGTMSATGGASAAIELVGGGRIVNSGLISGNGGAQAVSADGLTFLTNSGTITSTSTAITFDGSGGSRIANTGTIETSDTFAFIGGIGNDTLINRGTLNGDVFLGAGQDFFNTIGGQFTGTVDGGADDDVYRTDTAELAVVESLGGGTDRIESTVGFDLGTVANVEDLKLLGTAIEGIGNALNNTITGSVANNLIQGADGNDSIFGLAGNDRLFGDNGLDTIYGGDGEDTVRGGAGNDILHGENGDDVIRGDAGIDRLYGEDGEDLLIGGAGRDQLYGGADADLFRFERVSDSGAGATLRDQIIGLEAGLDLIDLVLIDANTTIAGNQAFTWIDSAAFAGIAGQLRVATGTNSLVQGDVNGDGVADFELQLTAIASVSVNDIML